MVAIPHPPSVRTNPVGAWSGPSPSVASLEPTAYDGSGSLFWDGKPTTKAFHLPGRSRGEVHIDDLATFVSSAGHVNSAMTLTSLKPGLFLEVVVDTLMSAIVETSLSGISQHVFAPVYLCSIEFQNPHRVKVLPLTAHYK